MISFFRENLVTNFHNTPTLDQQTTANCCCCRVPSSNLTQNSAELLPLPSRHFLSEKLFKYRILLNTY